MGQRKVFSFARKIFFVAATVFFVLVVTGCQYWYRDLKGYLEYWSGTVEMEGIEVDLSGANSQKNNSGVDTIPISTPLIITGYIKNPREYSIITTIGDASSTNAGIMVSNSAVKSNAKLIAHDFTMLKVRLEAPEECLEHTTFTINMKALRSETLVGAGVAMDVTFQYNTPPGEPIPVTKNSDGSFVLTQTINAWNLTDDGYLYWAWDDTETDEKSPQCAKWFKVNGNLRPLDECKVPGAQIDNYSVFSAKIDSTGNSISIAAVDSEGITGSTISTRGSGQVDSSSNILTYSNASDVIASLPGEGPTPLRQQESGMISLHLRLLWWKMILRR